MADEHEFEPAERAKTDPEVPSDESAGTEPEIEADESSGPEPGESPAPRAASVEPTCPIWIGRGGCPGCGRELHNAPDAVDGQPVCLMHSKDPRKQSELFDEFWRIFEGILKDAGEGEAHFDRFIFPQLDFTRRTFKARCLFTGAVFAQNANFTGATFAQKADFVGATFTKSANFLLAAFTQYANFALAAFTLDAKFSRATFAQGAFFQRAAFTQDAFFHSATFSESADFSGATFTQEAGFNGATFTKNAGFIGATFTQSAGFHDATFRQVAHFEETRFLGTADWRACRFLGQAEFRRTKFEPKIENTPSAIFSLAKFAMPGEVIFHDVDLSRAIFHDCDVSQVWFTSSARWARRPGKPELMIFEEAIPLGQEYARGIKINGRRDYGAISQTYRQLKKNYDARLDYWTANSFHYGEMEMRRLAESAEFRESGVSWFSRPRLNLLAWYGIASRYGISYRQAMLWLLASLAFFALLFPIPGLESRQLSPKPAETYLNVWDQQDTWSNNLWTEAKLVGKSAITAVDTATFQRNSEYTPAYPWGRVVAIFETLLTSTLFALFLLAIRRQFRR